MSNHPESKTLLKLRSYPPEFYLELANWALQHGPLTKAQRRTIKYAGNHLHHGWDPIPTKQKYLLHIIKKAVNGGFSGIEGIDISEFVTDKPKLEDGNEKQKFYREHISHKTEIMQELFRNQKGKCMYCGKEKHEPSDFDLDHKNPVALGGTNDVFNLQLICGSCNSRKHTMTDDEFRKKFKLPPSSEVMGPPKKILLQSYFKKISEAV